MKECKKCKQSFFDEVEECACGSQKFVYTVPPVIEPIISKKKDDDDDLIAEQEYEKKAEEVLRQKWGEPIRPNQQNQFPLIPNVFKPVTSSKLISTPITQKITQPFGISGGTTNASPLTKRHTSIYKFDPLTNKPMALPLSKREADEHYRQLNSQIKSNITRQKSFHQYKHDELLKRIKEAKDDE